MKYGLMYYKATDNIGDDIQTYAAIKYLPHIDYYIDRENLSCFVPKQKEYVSMIMNGWYIHNKLAWPPSPYINPLLISMHFKDLEDTDVGDSYLKGYGGEFLKKYAPVGARDTETMKRLEKNEIETYFSGCMTLTLEKFPRIKKRKKISLVDIEEDIIKKVKENTEMDIEVLSHSINQIEAEKMTVEERMNKVENLLKKYQEARLVITNRLHVALPCVALGTPVIVLHKEFFDEDRLGTFFNLFTNYQDTDFLNMDISNIIEKPRANSKEFIKIKRSINKACRNFINQCEDLGKNKKNIEDLPEIEDYQKYVDKLKWYKNIYEKERLIVEKIEHKRIEEYELYHKNLEELYKKIEEQNYN